MLFVVFCLTIYDKIASTGFDSHKGDIYFCSFSDRGNSKSFMRLVPKKSCYLSYSDTLLFVPTSSEVLPEVTKM